MSLMEGASYSLNRNEPIIVVIDIMMGVTLLSQNRCVLHLAILEVTEYISSLFLTYDRFPWFAEVEEEVTINDIHTRALTLF